MEIRVSVIMPLYNASRFLRESIGSILNQTFREYELICVNDASTDDTEVILESFRRDEERIKILRNDKRSGAAYSRNKGMREASGNYIMFLDGDDLFEKDLISLCYRAATTKKADIVIFNYKHFRSEDIDGVGYSGKSKEYYIKYSTSSFSFSNYADPRLLLDLSAACNKFYNRKFLQDNKIVFQNLPRQNDVCFSLLSLLTCDRVIALDEDRALVKARDHDEPTRISNTMNPAYTYCAIIYLVEEINRRRRLNIIMPEYYGIFLDFLIGANRQVSCTEQGKQYYIFLKKNGVATLRRLCNREKLKLDFYTLLREKCLDYNYDTLWWDFDEPSWVTFLLKENAKRICKYVNKYSANGTKIIMWGCGGIGREIIRFFNINNIKIDKVVDSDPSKWNKNFEGYKVSCLESLKSNDYLIIISSRGIKVDSIDISIDTTFLTSIYEIIYKCMENKSAADNDSM